MSPQSIRCSFQNGSQQMTKKPFKKSSCTYIVGGSVMPRSGWRFAPLLRGAAPGGRAGPQEGKIKQAVKTQQNINTASHYVAITALGGEKAMRLRPDRLGEQSESVLNSKSSCSCRANQSLPRFRFLTSMWQEEVSLPWRGGLILHGKIVMKRISKRNLTTKL